MKMSLPTLSIIVAATLTLFQPTWRAECELLDAAPCESEVDLGYDGLRCFITFPDGSFESFPLERNEDYHLCNTLCVDPADAWQAKNNFAAHVPPLSTYIANGGLFGLPPPPQWPRKPKNFKPGYPLD